jgi:hypothetical protein
LIYYFNLLSFTDMILVLTREDLLPLRELMR